MRQQELEKMIVLLKRQKKESYRLGLWTGFLLGIIAGIILAALSACEPNCYKCRIVTEWPELGQRCDTTIIVCKPLGGIKNFELNNTYIDTVLSDYDTYQTCNCK
jgi:hypothetical protein